MDMSPEDKIADLKRQLHAAHKEIERLSSPERQLAGELFEDLKFGYWEWNFNAERPFMGSAFTSILGYEAHEVDGDMWRHHIFKEDLDKVFRLFENHVASKGKIPFEVRLRFRHKQGHTVGVWGRGRVVRWNNDGSPALVAGGVADISELSAWQNAYRENVERLKLIVQGSKAGIWEWNIPTGEAWWSEHMLEMLGYSPGEVTTQIDKFMEQMLHPEDLENTRTALHLHVHERVPYKVEFRLKRKDGTYSWYEGSGKASYQNGQPVRMAGSLVNIDERKRLQLELEDQNELYKESEKLSRAGVFKLDLETGAVKWSDEVYRIYDRPIGTPINRELAFSHAPPEQIDEIKARIEAARTTGKAYEYESQITTSGGKLIWVRIKGIPRQNEEGKISSLLGVIQDIDESKRREIELKWAHEQLEQQNAIFRQAEEAAKLGSSEFDYQTGEIRWSEQVYKMHGLQPGQPIDLESILAAYYPPDRKLLLEGLKNAQEKGKAFDIQVRKWLFNELRWISIKGMPVFNGAGEAVKLRSVIQDINDLKMKEQQLRDQELLLLEASRIAHIGAWRYNLVTKDSVWSEEVFRIHEVPQDFETHNVIDFYRGPWKQKIKKGLKLTVETGKGFSLEAQMLTARGHRKWVKIKANAVKDASGKVVEIRGFIQDINDRKTRELQLEQMQKVLLEQNKMFREAERSAKIGSWEYDVETENFHTSEQVHRIMEIKKPSLEQGFGAVDEPYRQRLWKAFTATVNQGKPYEMQLPVTTGKGNKKWVIAKAVYDEDAHKARGVFLDITELKEKKNALRRYNRELEKQQQLLTQAEKMARLGYWEWVKKSNEVRWSEQVYQILEAPSEMQPGRDHLFSSFHRSEDQQKLQAGLEKALAGEGDFHLEVQLNTFTDNVKWVRLQGSPLHNSRGKVIGTFGTIQDIDEQKKRQIQVEETANIVAAQNKRLRDFTHIVSHNLRSHSSNLQTMLNFLEAAQGDATEIETSVQFIRETANNLHQTLDYLNEALQVQTRPGLKKEKIDVASSLQSILNVLKGEITLTGAQIQCDLQVKEIKFVRPYFDSILLNLVSNSLKYRHPDRSPEVRVRTFVTGRKKTVLEVQDNGLGINLERNRGKLFGLYKTFHRNSEARGVGLFITNQQVLSQGGKMEVESTEGEGSVFRVIL